MRTRRRVRPLTTDEILELIRREYLALPGLRLTEEQVCRIWGLEPVVCRTIMRTLVESRVLACAPDGRYVRADVLSATMRQVTTRRRQSDRGAA